MCLNISKGNAFILALLSRFLTLYLQSQLKGFILTLSLIK